MISIGLENRKTQFAETNLSHFPDDFPDTVAGTMHENFQALISKNEHEKRPPAKRVNYEKLQTPFPFAPGWADLLRVQNSQASSSSSSCAPTTTTTTITAAAEMKQPDQQQQQQQQEEKQSSLSTSPPLNKETVEIKPSPSFFVLRDPEQLTQLQDLPPRLLPPNTTIEQQLSKASCKHLVQVALKFWRSAPLTNAMICFPTDEDIENWKKHGSLWTGPEMVKISSQGYNTRPVIGYVTHGFVSNVRGRGHAIGFCRGDMLEYLPQLPFPMSPSSILSYPPQLQEEKTEPSQAQGQEVPLSAASTINTKSPPLVRLALVRNPNSTWYRPVNCLIFVGQE